MPQIDTQTFTACAPGCDGYRRDHPAAAHADIIDAASGIIDLQGRKHLALCGFAESSRKYIPVDDPKWIVVGLNQLYRHLPRWDVMFDVHEYWREGNLEGTDHAAWLATCGIPVFMAQVEPSVPTSVRFPIDRVIAKGGLDYLTSTFAYMLAWAIDHIDREVANEASGVLANHNLNVATNLWEAHERLQALYAQWTIGIFGIDLLADTEFSHQRPCAEFWIGRASARGIAIGIPPESALLKQPFRYGTRRDVDGLLRLSDFEARSGVLDVQMAEAVAKVERLVGRREEQVYWRQIAEIRQRGGTVPESLLRMTD